MIKPCNEIKIGSRWRPNDGGSWRVIIVDINKDIVYYFNEDNPSIILDRELFYFQVRYREDDERL